MDSLPIEKQQLLAKAFLAKMCCEGYAACNEHNCPYWADGDCSISPTEQEIRNQALFIDNDIRRMAGL